MKVISLGMGQNIFTEDSAVRQRQIKYGKIFDELHLIVFTPNDLSFQNQKLSDNVFLYPTKSKIRAFYIFDFLRIISKILKSSGQKDIILTCQDPFEIGIVGTLAKLFFNLPLHIQIHTDLGHKYFRQSSLLNRIRFMLSEFVLKYSDRIRVVSGRIKNSIEHFSKNIDVLPIKTEINLGSGEEVKKPFLFTLLMVCRLEKEKNIETVLQAIKNLDVKDVGLCIVGDGSQKDYLEKTAQNMGISNKIFFAGWKNNLAPYYKMADVFISSSWYEGYGISTMEAAYFGKPIILSDTGLVGFSPDGFKDPESAFVCDAKDPECFGHNILKIYENKNLAFKLGQSAKAIAERRLNSEKNYYKEYADSILKTPDSFIKRNFLSRIFYFKKTVFNSFMILRYFICGITAASANILSLYLFTDTFGIWYLYSSILAFFLSLIISFVLQKFVVFRDTGIDKIHRQFSKFFIVAVLGVITNTVLVFVCTDIIDIWYIISQIIAGFFVMIQNFILYKFFIFNK